VYTKCYFCFLVSDNSLPTRVIGRHEGVRPGPLLICVGGMHGNEPAGVAAVDLLLKMLEVEPITNPDFVFRGTMVGIRGNLHALRLGQRYIKKDLNRSLTREYVNHVLEQDPDTLQNEDWEIYHLVHQVRSEIATYQPDKIVVLDLHTTTAFGGIFTLASRDEESIRIGIEMHAPVITGFERDITGTTMGYFAPRNFDRDIVTVVFESGQHYERLSVNRAIAAIINCMRTIGCVRAEDVENRHDYLLREYAQHLPKVAELVDRYQVDTSQTFNMLPDFKNFQPVQKGQTLAYSNGTPVRASKDGLLLMPKYQKQGDDGFFIISPLDGY
ncbi:MAG: succinylglutamate desuccinylase/aspartoacylase family protein, partial [Saprospiraceae bacterium]|nr:succinylglutamate desuccinylase/aspartoacylase family protein [Saprospiraceae bacterium]